MQGLRYRRIAKTMGLVLLALACAPANAQTQVVNTAEVTLPDGVSDADPGNNSDSATVDVYAVALAKSADPASGTAVAVGDTIDYTITATVSAGATTSEPVVVTDTLGPGLQVASPPTGCTQSGSTLTCTIPAGTSGTYTIDYSAEVLASAGTSVDNSVAGGDDCSAGCSTTHTVLRGVTLTKSWANGAAGDSVALAISGPGVAGAVAGSSAAGGATTPATGDAAAGSTVTVAEVFTPAGSAANYATTLSCVRDADGGTVAVGGSGPSGTFTMPADSAVSCTITNTRIAATLRLDKTWVNAAEGDTATVSTSGFTNTASTASTADATGGNTTEGTPVTVFAGESGTISETLGNPGDYTATLACTGTSGLSGTTLAVGPTDTEIVCTQTNTRLEATLTLQKSWVNAAVGETATVAATGSETGPVELDSVADTATETDSAGPFDVFVGETITLEETLANAANYGTELACTGAANWSAGATSFQVAPGDSAITCTYTNTRLQTRLQLEKVWGPNSQTGDAAQLGPTTGLVNNTTALNVVAPTSGVTPFVIVYAGEVATLPAETMAGTALGNYDVAVDCTGGTLDDTDGSVNNTLEILPTDTGDITCTYTNSRVETTLQLQKTWVNAIAGDSVTLIAEGLPEFDSTASGGASQTDTSAEFPVYAGQVIRLTETFTGPPDVYGSSLECTGTDSLVLEPDNRSGTITVAAGDGPILCTFINDRRSAQLVVEKVWDGGGPPSQVTIPASTGFINNTPQLVSTSPTSSQTAAVTVFVQENGTLPAEQFTTGDPGDYDSTVTCDGADTNPDDGLLIQIADAGSTITCTYSNTFIKRAELSVDKTVTSAPPTAEIEAGSVIEYQVTVTNTGNVPVTGVDVADDLADDLSCTPGEPLDLGVGESTTCTASYTVTQADIDRTSANGADGTITNNATADGTDPDGDPVHGGDSTDTALPVNLLEFGFVKDAQLVDSNGSINGSVGETINYTFTITNEGNTSITIDTLVDDMLPDLACSPLPFGPVAPGGSVEFGPAAPADVVCSGLSHTITQEDIDNQGTNGSGEIQNTATASGSGPSGGSESRDATDNVPLDPPQPQIQLDKTADPTEVDSAGDVITYTFVVTNPGNVTVSGITVTDDMPGLGAISCTPAAPFDLAPGARAECQAQYTVSQADIDAGGDIVNTASAEGNYDGNPVDDDDTAAVDVDTGPAQPELEKFATPDTVTAAGQVVTFTFRVTNPSPRTLLNLQIIDDPLLPDLACDTIPSLAPNTSADFNCTAGNTYVVKQSDIDNQGNPTPDSGVIANTATGQAEYVDDGQTVIATDDASALVDLPGRAPSIFLTKGSDVASVTEAGDPIAYSFHILNNGNVTLTNIRISDPLLPDLDCPAIASLEPGQEADFTCIGTTNIYPVTQEDIDTYGDGGQIVNVATTIADTPAAGVTVSDDDDHRVDLPVRRPDLTLEKSANVTSISAPVTVQYQFRVENTGNVTINDLVVADATLGMSCPVIPELLPGQVLTLGPAGSDVVCTNTQRVVDQDDIDTLDSIDNTVTANGQTEVDGPIEREDTLDLPINKTASLRFEKSASVPSVTLPGDPIVYTIEGENTGNVTLENVTVTDPLLASPPGGVPLSCTPASPIAALAPGGTFMCTGTYPAQQSDFDTFGGGDGTIDNTASAAWDGGGTSDSTSVALPSPVRELSLVKTAGTPTTAEGIDPDVTDAEDTITYTFEVTNEGNQTLTDIRIIDANLESDATCDPTAIEAGAVSTCTGVHIITQAEMDAGRVDNTANARGDSPSGDVITSGPDEAEVILDTEPAITLDKQAGTPTETGGALPGATDAGDTITYTFQVTNSGNVTLRDVTVTDPLPGLGGITCPTGQVAPGESVTCSSATHTITQAEMDAGEVTNTATAAGITPSGGTVDDDDSTTTPLAPEPAFTLEKSASTPTYTAAGQTVTYSYLVTNTGSVSISALQVGDDLIPSVTCPATELAPTQSTTCTGTYVITQDDVDTGSVTNNAEATATPSQGTLAPVTDSETITADQTATLTLVKSASPTNVSAVGEEVTYSFEVTNSGNVTVDALTITEMAFSGTGTPPAISCPVTELAPAASTTCTGTYAVTQADLDAGSVTNTATANGTDPGGAAVVSDPSTATVTADQTPALLLDKSTTSTTYDSVGDTLQYSYEVTNSGNVTITGAITVDDDRIVAPNSVNCPALPAGGLAPGDSITCTATHIVSQADLDAGSVVNVATATDGSTVSPPDSETVDGTQVATIVLDKTASVDDTNGDGVVGDAGDTITYAFSVENTGNVILAPVAVTDPLLPSLSCSIPTLEPGDTASCVATGNTHVITTADEANGSVENTALATGDAPGPAPDATDEDTLVTPTSPTPATTSVAKVADPVSGTEVSPGDTLTYTVTVTVADASLHEPVTLTDTLGTGLTFVAVTSPGEFTCNAANPLVCTLPAGTAPGSYPLVYTATVDDDATDSVGNNVVADKPPGVDPDPVCTSCDTDHPVVPSTSTVSKSSTPASNVPVNPGTTITFTLTTVVSGSVTTEPITLVDTLDPGLTFAGVTDAGDYTCSGGLTCVLPAGTLPGSYDVVYTATVDADASGDLRNTVVPGNPPGGDAEPVCTTCETVHPVSRPSVALEKEVTDNDDADGNGEVSVGDTLTYTVTATNTGNVPLANVTIVDELVTPGSATCALVQPGGRCELVATYVVTQADADAGQVLNTATVTTEAPPDVPPLPPQACPAGSTDPACTADNVTPVIQRPAIATTKAAVLSVDNATPGKGNIGDVVTYTVNATNTGNITLTGVTVTDTFQGGTPVPLTCAPGTLAPRQTATCDSYDHTVTEADVRSDEGLLVNTVLAQGDAGVITGTVQVTANAAAQVEVQNEPAQLHLIKAVGVRQVNVGDLVRYTLTLENTGETDLVDGYLVDTPAPGFTYVEGSLQGDDDDDFVTASGSSPLRISDIDIAAGNTATMSYLMRVGAGVRPGAQVNRAIAYDPAYDGPASNEATAEVLLGSDPLLDESLISGTVFSDRDGDSWQDSAALTGVRVQGGFAPGAYVAGSTTVDRGDGPQAEPDASAPLLHGIAVGRIDGRQSVADPASAHEVVIRQRLRELDFTDDFVLTSEQGATVRMAADGSTTVEARGDAAKGLTAAAPTVERQVAQAGDGYQVDYVVRNEGIDERGIPGVRIASVEGLLIETDQYGRYHLVGIDAGQSARGRNFILKVDTATLPKGAELTTENPKVRRITGGVPTRFDFGVRLPEQVIEGHRQVEMTLGTVVFAPGSAQVQPRYLPVVDSMAEQVRRNGTGEVVISADGETEALAFARATAVRALLDERLDEAQRAQVTLSVRADPDDPASLLAGIGEGGPVLGTLLFDTDQATIKPRFDALLDQVAQMLAASGGGSVAIIGHADRRGSREYNAALGMRRAKAVYEALAPRLPPDLRARLTVEVDPDPDAPLAEPTNQEGKP